MQEPRLVSPRCHSLGKMFAASAHRADARSDDIGLTEVSSAPLPARAGVPHPRHTRPGSLRAKLQHSAQLKCEKR